jgi:MoaA/NifB/PqqE/SkfB family radical SAM enzyme
MLRVADALISLQPPSVQLSGGEPLIVKGLFEVAERFVQAGIPLTLYTSGWLLEEWMIPELFRLFSYIHVSVDGPTARIHDAIRGRAGSFDRAVRALTLLDEAAREERELHGRSIPFGLDCVVTRSNFDHLEPFCTELAPRFPEMKFLLLGAAVPSGLSNRPGMVAHELLDEEQLRRLGSPEFTQHLQSLAPASVHVQAFHGRDLQMHPDDIASGTAPVYIMQVEPDGDVRGMAIYEGTVGNLLEEPAQTLWERVFARPNDPFVVETLAPVRTMQEWAEAARRIDYHFGSEEVRARIDRRPEYPAPRPPITRLDPSGNWEVYTPDPRLP